MRESEARLIRHDSLVGVGGKNDWALGKAIGYLEAVDKAKEPMKLLKEMAEDYDFLPSYREIRGVIEKYEGEI